MGGWVDEEKTYVPNVTLDGRGDDAILKGENGLVDKARNQAVLDFFLGKLALALSYEGRWVGGWVG